ncbi:MAG: hypothetical protein NTX61_06095 [Bacteroidetes bacterium]|nr:hypothetical protein [Bacteroidota bacterium]
MSENYQILIRKLDEFIRKYYRNRLLKGLILFLAIFLFAFLLITILEFFGHFDHVTRTVFFYLFIVANALVFISYILDPLLKLQKIGKVISYEQASQIIGKHFVTIQDKLLNTLQLKKLAENGNEDLELLQASIDQRIIQLRPVPFISAIDLSRNKKFLRYAIPPALIILIMGLISPSMITRPAGRIIHHNKEFEVEFPFHMVVLNKSLEAFQQEDFTLSIKVSGEKIPGEIELETEGSLFKMNRDNNLHFSYTFKTLQKTIIFRMVAGKFRSEQYELKVYPKPVILNYNVELTYPAYINRQKEIIENTGDIVIPQGSNVKWQIYTKDVDAVIMKFDTLVKLLDKKESNRFEYSSSFSKNIWYKIQSKNAYSKKHDSLSYSITVIPDVAPSITVQETKDSTVKSKLFFQGVIKDDYGFSRLTFNYTIIYNGDTNNKDVQHVNLSINKNINQQQFYYSFDLAKVIKNPGDQVDYYFEVCDNDGIHGPKCARTRMYQFKAPTLEEVEQITAKQEQSITKDLENSLRETKKLEQQIDDLNKKLNDKSTLSWQERKQIEELLERQKSIKENLEDIQKQNDEKNAYEEQYKQIDQSIMEKQKKLSELISQVMDEDMKKMLEKINELLDKIDKTKINEMLEKMKFDNKDLEKQLDRSLELFKQIEFEKNLSETIEKLDKLAEKQEKLSEDTKRDENSTEKLEQNQKEINKDFEDLKDKLKDLEKKNKELEEPNQFPDTKQDEEAVQEELSKSSKALEKKNRKEASKSQKNSAKNMKSMSKKLQDMEDGMEMEQMEENVERLRQILQYLVRISFDQEELISRTNTTQRTDPKFLKIIEDQNNLKEDLKLVEDSLYQLAKREASIKPYIMREISAIDQNIGEAVKSLDARNLPVASIKQQFVMTAVNNLALMLSESLKDMENNMQSQMQMKGGKTSCKNGKMSGKMSLKNMRAMQELLNKQMQKMKEKMDAEQKQGKQPYGKPGGQQMSEQLAKMAAQQEAIRQEMKKYIDGMNEQGMKDQNGLNDAMDKMEKTEKDLVNKRILQETINRQAEILTRLLESEKAEQKRGQEEKRQSTEAKEGNYSNPKTNFQYNMLKYGSTELLKTVQPEFNNFYKTKINSYFLKFQR